MAPKRAKEFIQSFELPDVEEMALIECDVKKRSYPQVFMENYLTPGNLNQIRMRAFAHIADALEHDEKMQSTG